MSKFESSFDFKEKQEKWNEIENLVIKYKYKFNENCDEKMMNESKKAAKELLEKFQPLFKKYIVLLKLGQINFNDADIKYFIGTFIEDPRLHRALKRQKSRAEYKADIYNKFRFVLETYGQQSEDDIMIDLQMLLLTLAKRYKQMGKNFCTYVYNCYRYEVSRHIKDYIKNPINISYKNFSFEDRENFYKDELSSEMMYEDMYHEPEDGIPNMLWINGKTCNDPFNILNPLERKIIIKYYIEDYNDKQVAEILGFHINTINEKRRHAVAKLAENLNINILEIKRSRHSGKRRIY